jgi:hypothetical protein
MEDKTTEVEASTRQAPPSAQGRTALLGALEEITLESRFVVGGLENLLNAHRRRNLSDGPYRFPAAWRFTVSKR